MKDFLYVQNKNLDDIYISFKDSFYFVRTMFEHDVFDGLDFHFKAYIENKLLSNVSFNIAYKIYEKHSAIFFTTAIKNIIPEFIPNILQFLDFGRAEVKVNKLRIFEDGRFKIFPFEINNLEHQMIVHNKQKSIDGEIRKDYMLFTYPTNNLEMIL